MDLILHFRDVLDFDLWPHPPGMDPWVRYHGMKANPTGYLWSKSECFLINGYQDMDLILHSGNVLEFNLWPHPLAWTLRSHVME